LKLPPPLIAPPSLNWNVPLTPVRAPALNVSVRDSASVLPEAIEAFPPNVSVPVPTPPNVWTLPPLIWMPPLPGVKPMAPAPPFRTSPLMMTEPVPLPVWVNEQPEPTTSVSTVNVPVPAADSAALLPTVRLAYVRPSVWKPAVVFQN
jgi:hypothetical protein